MRDLVDTGGILLSNKRKLLIILFFISAITVAHYTISHSVVYLHDISRRLYYLPIILSGLWFGRNGGIYSAASITILYFPHALFAWYGKHPRYLDNIIEIVFFNIVGYLIGSYIEKRNIRQQQAEQSALKLEQAYRQLELNTERIAELEGNIRFADRLSILGELSASMAHEVRNPLGGIQGAAEILRKKIPAEAEEAEFIQIQLTEIKRLNKVVENYLNLAGNKNIIFKKLNISELIHNSLDLVRIPANKKQIKLVIDIPEQNELFINGDDVQIQQVLLNLSLNAIQAMPDNGKLEISAGRKKTENKILISIHDSGPGIDPKSSTQIFNTFFTTKTDGTGLGLSIVKRIVDGHQGKIWFESDATGTTFFVQLPQAEE